MTIASAIYKQVNVVKQAGLGVLGSSGSQTIRRTQGVGSSRRSMTQSAEITSHHQSTGSTYGVKSATYKLDGEVSAGTYKIFEEGMLEAAYAAVTPYAAGTDVTASATAPQFVDASGGFLTAGLKVGDVGRWTGFAGAGATDNNARNFWITALTATDMTGVFLDGTAVTADASGDSVTFTVVGKKCLVPLTGHTKDYLTIEDYYGDLTDSDLYGDQVVAGIDYALPAEGKATISIATVGRSRTPSGTQVLTLPSAESTTALMTMQNGLLYVNGVATQVTNLSISIKNGAAGTGAETGGNGVHADVVRGAIEVSGSFTSNLRDQIVTALYEAETEIGIAAVMTADETATSDFKAFRISKIKITDDDANDAQTIYRTYNWTARINSDGGAALADDKTIISLQDSAA